MSFPYRIQKPDDTQSLPPTLKEISGICPLDGNWLACVQDEKRDIYELKGGRVVARFKSGKRGDCEDIVVLGKSAFVLEGARCALYEYANFRQSMKRCRKHRLDLDRAYEPEGLCYDADKHCLLIACKGSPNRGSRERKVFLYDLHRQKRLKQPYFSVDTRELVAKSNGKTFNPSAIAIHPVSGEIYMLGSRDLKMVVRLSRDGRRVLGTEKLRKSAFGQPEGIGFSEHGDLFISTEAKGGAPARLCRFRPA